ncbi:glycosyl hydrolase family 3 N terminal domain-domain-containing protein [Microdochium bolleyi]|uniref:beta-glucosidase n=1 Tax=Microdochium bolleyi TaxID=196109 RepID=A0A136IUR7_9PEZI|nr:glycosyl hydrolase family 3 N terminal domain-domain-containing protein [Microdochium bolleyi]
MGSVQQLSSAPDARGLPLDVLAGLVGGRDFWHTHEHSQLGLASIRFSDGPNGVRGEDWVNGAPSAAIPCATALGASFDRQLVRRAAQLLASECYGKGVHALLAPTMNIHRYALCGRNFESFSEDPYLTGALATEYVQALQQRGIAATPKHFLANEAENGRRWSNSVIDQRALREIYLEPFRMVVQDAQPWALMTAYNSVNGAFCSESSQLLSILRNEWRFAGAIISDWFGTYSTAPAIQAGLDLELPGPCKFRTQDILEKSLAQGLVTREQLEQSAQRVMGLLEKTGRVGPPGKAPAPPTASELEARLEDPVTTQLLVEAAEGTMVLLKNDRQTLPIEINQASSAAAAAPQKVVVFGSHATQPSLFGGGSASLKVPATTPSPWEGIRKLFPEAVLSQGSVATGRLVQTPGSQDGLLSAPRASGQLPVRIDWFNGSQPTLEHRFLSQHVKDTVYMLVEDVPSGLVDLSDFCTAMTFAVCPTVSGVFDLSLCGPGDSTCSVDGKTVLAVSRDTAGVSTEDFLFDRSKLEARCADGEKPLALQAGQTYEFVVTSWSSKHKAAHVNREFFIQGCRFGLQPASDDEAALARARLDAAQAEVAIVVVGTGPEWESEGFDRISMSLPRRQADLITAVAESVPATGRTIVVVNAGSPIVMGGWIDKVDAVVYAWFPGSGFATALGNLLVGSASPAARLPTTFWDRAEDYPAGHVEALMQSGSNDILYCEGVSVGYRSYGAKVKSSPSAPVPAPSFAFAHGLTYTEFVYKADSDTPLQVMEDFLDPEHRVSVSIEVENVGCRAGTETVLLFVKRPAETASASIRDRPEVELRAFDKTASLGPAERQRVTLGLSRRSFAYWDVETGAWRVDAGRYQLLFAGRRGVGDWQSVTIPVYIFLTRPRA